MIYVIVILHYAGAVGDNDPIDAIEIGTEGTALPMGTVIAVKVLGSLELIDEGEKDHKIIVIRNTDPHFDDIDTLEDLEQYGRNKGVVSMLKHWLKYYKTSDGKGVNMLGNNEHVNDAASAMSIIGEVSDFYDNLIDGTTVVEDEFALPSNTRHSSSSESSSKSHSSHHKKVVDINEPATDDEGY